MKNKQSIAIIGGLGHVGLPLGLLFANKNFNVNLIDIIYLSDLYKSSLK